MMDSQERTFRALCFEEPDRVPIDVWMSAGYKRKLAASGSSFDEFLDAHDVDLRYIEGPAYIGPPLRTFPDGGSEDIWGVRRVPMTVSLADGAETYQEVAESPLQTAESPEAVHAYDHWPSPDWFDYSEIEAQCNAVREKGRFAVFMGDRMNRLAQLKPAMYIRGMETIWTDFYLNPGVVRAIFGCIRRFYVGYAERIFDAAKGKLDLLLSGDDFGGQEGPLLPEQIWLEFLADGFAEYIALAKAHDVRVMHHTCGSVRPLIPHMIERGLDVLQSLQPEAAGMDPHALKTEFGDRLAFHGGISIQRTLPFGSPEDVRNEVRDRVEALAPGGGYILGTSHNIQADTSTENVEALLAAYHEFGRY